MKKRILCALLALLLLCSCFVACNDTGDAPTGNTPGAGNGGSSTTIDESTTENYLPSELFAKVKTAFEKKDVSNFPALTYDNAPFSIADDAFAGKKIAAITIPVQKTGEADDQGMLQFTLYVMPNTYDAMVSAKSSEVTAHVVKIDPAAYGIEAGKKVVSKYITVDLTAYNLQLTESQTLAIGAKTDTVMLAALDTSATNSATASAIFDWREDWLVIGYYLNLFTGKTGKDNGGLYFTRDSLPIDFVFDYGTADAKKAVVDARKAEEDAYAEKLAAVAEAYDGKYLSLIGDSISSFTGVTNDTSRNEALYNNRCYYGKSFMNDYTQMYWGRLADECNMELCVINGWSSSRVYGGGSGAPGIDEANKSKLDNMLTRSTTLHTNDGQKPDLIILYMGINDISHTATWSDLYDRLAARGSKTATEIVEEWLVGVHNVYNANRDEIIPGTTYKSWEASYALSLERMKFNYPDAEIYIMNLTRTHNESRKEELLHKANTCLAALAEYYGVNIIDQAKSEITYENCHLYGADEANPTALHPNLMGHALMTKLIVETLYENLPKG